MDKKMTKVITGVVIYLIISKMFENIVNAHVESIFFKIILAILFFFLVMIIVSRIFD